MLRFFTLRNNGSLEKQVGCISPRKGEDGRHSEDGCDASGSPSAWSGIERAAGRHLFVTAERSWGCCGSWFQLQINHGVIESKPVGVAAHPVTFVGHRFTYGGSCNSPGHVLQVVGQPNDRK